MSALKEKEISEKYKKHRFTSHELYNFYNEIEEGELKKTTFRWRVYLLKKQGIIRTVSRGVYEIGQEKKFLPQLSKNAMRIYRKLKKEFPYVDFVIWETEWLNNFMIHQTSTMNIIVEVEPELVDDVFNYLYLNEKNVVLSTKNEIGINNIVKNEHSTIVSSLVLNKPVMRLDKFTVPKIEAIIVDLFIEENILGAYQGKEKAIILENLFQEYTIMRSTIENYANKRGVLKKIKYFIENETNINF